MNMDEAKKYFEELKQSGYDDTTIKSVIIAKYGVDIYNSLIKNSNFKPSGNNEGDEEGSEKPSDNFQPIENSLEFRGKRDYKFNKNNLMILVSLLISIVIVSFILFLNKETDYFKLIKNIDEIKLMALINEDAEFNPNMLNERGRSLFSIAVEENSNKEVIQILIQQGANVNKREGEQSPLMYAVRENENPEITQLLIDSGAEVNEIDPPFTPLSKAILASDENNSSLDIIAILLNNGANVMYKDQFMRRSILHEAANQNCSPEIFRLLIKHNADVNAIDKLYKTPLMAAAENCTNLEIIDILINSGADLYTVDFLDKDVFDYAEENENPEILKSLKEKEKIIPPPSKEANKTNYSNLDLGFSDYTYRKLVRNEYVIPGTTYSFEGKVSQWIEDGSNNYYMIYTKDTGYGYNDHLVLVAVPPLLRDIDKFIEGDIVIFEDVFYVEPFKYKTALGTTNVIPGFGCDQETRGTLK